MPTIEKQIKTLSTNINKLIEENDYSKNIQEYQTLNEHYTSIDRKLKILRSKIETPKDYVEEIEFDDEKSYGDEFNRLNKIKDLLEKKDFKLEKMVNLYLEVNELVYICDQKLSSKELTINELN